MEDPSPVRRAGDASLPSSPPSSPLSPAHLLHSAAASLLSLFPSPSPSSPKNNRLKPNPNPNPNPNTLEPSTSSMILPFPYNTHRSLPRGHGRSSSPLPTFGTVRIDGLDSGAGSSSGCGGGGPAFVGQVFSMCDPLGRGLIAMTRNFDIPFLSNRMPDWVKNVFKFNKRENSGAVFRFFVDFNDAVAYVRGLKIPSGTVGACRLHYAYENYKEQPRKFKFVPNAKQVKAANKLLKANRRNGRKKLDGVPVFSAQNLNIAIATNDGIKWYMPYFFDKNLLDNILEASVDRYFQTLILTRHSQRRHDSFGDDMNEAFVDGVFEPPEVDEVAEEVVEEIVSEMDFPEIPLNVMSKVAEIHILDVVDRVILGNRWLRKATGIQPKFPYLVDSFEARSAASILKATNSLTSSDPDSDSSKCILETPHNSREMDMKECKQGVQAVSQRNEGFRIPFWDWFPNPWLKPPRISDFCEPTKRFQAEDGDIMRQQCLANPFLPKITMVGISSDKGGNVSKASFKKTMSKLTQDLEQNNPRVPDFNDKDPLFVANMGDYPTIMRVSTA